jgi:hypothetical protein
MFLPGTPAYRYTGIYSDWVYNAKCIVGTTHMLMTKPVVFTDSMSTKLYIEGKINYNYNCGYIMRHTLWVFPETTTTATLVLICETLCPLFCTIAQ